MNNNALFKITQKYILYRGADKSLDRPGRKQATATKLQLLQATQKQFRRLPVQTGLRGSNDLRVRQKWRTFNCFFQSGWDNELSAPLYNTNQRNAQFSKYLISVVS